MRGRAKYGHPMTAHSVMEELLLYLCNEEATALIGLSSGIKSPLFFEILSEPITAESIFVVYNQEGYIYGFDWLQNKAAQARKELIEKDPLEFLYFTHPTNKGTIQTAEMLVDAQNEEELAAIWIAAAAKELYEYRYGNGIERYANMLHMAACEFLQTRRRKQ